MDDGSQVDTKGNDIYTKTRWNNQFKHMSKLPDHLNDLLDSKIGLKLYNQPHPEEQDNDTSLGLTKIRQTSKQTILSKDTFSEVSVLARHEKFIGQKPKWHAPWKLLRVVNGHAGWVRCVAFDPVDNDWFATGSNDTTIKIWDIASGKLKITLSGHIMSVRDIAISNRHAYLFSASEDKLAKCWDLEKNMAIRDFHGHFSGVHTIDVHPSLDVIATAGRDAVVRLWDVRSRSEIMTLRGHKGPINKLKCIASDPQIVSSSNDATVRLWDIVAGKASNILTHHKRGVRDIALHPTEFSFASCCTDDIRSWKLPEGSLLTNFGSDKTGIINSLSINQDDVLVGGGDNGVLSFYDYRSGHKYQSLETSIANDAISSERGILCSSFDKTGLRLVTGEVDKTIKMWKQLEDVNPDDFPGLPWNPSMNSQRL